MRWFMNGVVTGVLVAAGGGMAGAAVAAEPLVDADWLAANLGDEDLVVLEIRSSGDTGSHEAFEAAHIPGAVYSNYGDAGWRVTVDGVPGMTPPVPDLEALIGNLGIDDNDHVVVVHGGINASDFGSAARVYWTFRYLGHDEVSILDGGWRAWVEDDSRPVESGPQGAISPAAFKADVQPNLLVSTADVEASLDDPRVVRIDARPEAQYRGEAAHPKAGKAGRLPGAIGLEQALFIDPDTGKVRPKDELAAIVPDAVKSGDADRLISYCNTGHWAATNWFVLSEVLGYRNVKLYDGSMTGWTFDPSRPVETGKGLLEAVSRWVKNTAG